MLTSIKEKITIAKIRTNPQVLYIVKHYVALYSETLCCAKTSCKDETFCHFCDTLKRVENENKVLIKSHANIHKQSFIKFITILAFLTFKLITTIMSKIVFLKYF